MRKHKWMCQKADQVSFSAAVATVALLGPLTHEPAQAATRTWVGASESDWNTPGSWSPASKPGAADLAVFNSGTSTSVAIAVADQAIQDINFTTAAGNFTIGATNGYSLLLSRSLNENTGVIQVTDALSGTGKTFTINSPITLVPGGPTSTGGNRFRNLNTDATNTLNFGGAISGGTTTNTSTLTLDGVNTGNNTISGVISNGGTAAISVLKQGTGTWTLSGTNSFTGSLRVSQGTLVAGSSSAAGATELLMGSGGLVATFDLNGQTLSIPKLTSAGGTTPANLTITNNSTSADAELIITSGGSGYNGNVSDGASKKTAITVYSSGTTTLTGNNTSTGGLNIRQGTVKLGSTAAAGSGVVTIGSVGNNAVLDLNALIANRGRNIVSLATAGTAADQTITHLGTSGFVAVLQYVGDGASTFGGSIIDGSATQKIDLTMLSAGGTGKLTLSGTNAYSGLTTVSAGTLQFGKVVSLYGGNTALWTATNAVGEKGIVVNSGATLAVNVGGTGEFTSANVDTLKALGTSTAGFRSGSILGLDTTNAAGGTFAYSSVIANPNAGANVLGLTKLGSNTLSLSGNNTYTGATNVSAGTLLVNGSLASGSAVTVSNGGTLGGTGTIGGAVTLNTGGHIAPGNSPGKLTTGAQIWEGGAFYDFELKDATGLAGNINGFDTVAISGALTINATSGNQFTVAVRSLDALNTPGNVSNFNSATDYHWLIADATSAISSFNANAFKVTTTAFTNPHTGTWAIARGDSILGGDDSQLYLTYTAVPEPATLAVFGVAGLLALRRLRTPRNFGLIEPHERQTDGGPWTMRTGR